MTSHQWVGTSPEISWKPNPLTSNTSISPGALRGFRASLIAQLVKNPLQCGRPHFDSCVVKTCWRRDRLPITVFLGFLCGSAGKESARNVGDPGSIPGLGRSSWEQKGYPFQYSGLKNSMDCRVHWVTKSWTWLSDFHFLRSFTGRCIMT